MRQIYRLKKDVGTWCRWVRAVSGIRCMLDLSVSWRSRSEQAQTPGTFHIQQMQRTAWRCDFRESPWSHAQCWVRLGPSCSRWELGLGKGQPWWKTGMWKDKGPLWKQGGLDEVLCTYVQKYACVAPCTAHSWNNDFFFCCIYKCFIFQTVIEADISVKPLRPCVVTGHWISGFQYFTLLNKVFYTL